MTRPGPSLLWLPTEVSYAVARPAFFQTSVRAAFACASVGEAADAHAPKADMPEVKTMLCVSAAQPETVIFCEAFALFASP